MPLYSINQGTSGGSWDLMQAIQALSGTNDVGAIKSFAQISAPGAPSVAILAQSGNLTGNYQYAVAFVTGYVQGQSVAQGGTLYTQGNTGGGTPSATVSPSAQQVSLSNIPVGPTGTVARILYRTQANGSSFFVLAQLNENTSTTYTDNTADANLGAAMPTTNTTGSWFQGVFKGDGSGLTNLPAPASYPWANLTGVPADLAKLDVAQTFTAEPTFNAGITGTGSVGSLTVPWANLTSVPTDFAKTDTTNTFTQQQTFNATGTFFGPSATGAVGIELGSTTTIATAYIDFHTSGSTNDYDARIIASGGTSGTVGAGMLEFVAAEVQMPSQTASPANPGAGYGGLYVNSSNRFMLWNGSAWVDPLKYQ